MVIINDEKIDLAFFESTAQSCGYAAASDMLVLLVVEDSNYINDF